jgi:predicted GIY-YIG superfamily endonuclease
MYKIYYLTSILDCRLPRYIGYSTNIEKRLTDHVNEAKYNKAKSHKINWIKSILNKNSLIELYVLDEFSDLDSALEAERNYIEYFNIWYKLTNSTNGGEVSKTFTQEVRKKMSERIKQYFKENKTWNQGLRYTFSEERNKIRREKIGDKITGKNNHFFGKKHTLETRKILSKSNRIHNYTYEQIFDLYIRNNISVLKIQ